MTDRIEKFDILEISDLFVSVQTFIQEIVSRQCSTITQGAYDRVRFSARVTLGLSLAK